MRNAPEAVNLSLCEIHPRSEIRHEVIKKARSIRESFPLLSSRYIDDHDAKSLPGFTVEISEEEQEQEQENSEEKYHDTTINILVFVSNGDLNAVFDELDETDLLLTRALRKRPVDFIHEWERVSTEFSVDKNQGFFHIGIINLKYQATWLSILPDENEPENLEKLAINIQSTDTTDTIIFE